MRAMGARALDMVVRHFEEVREQPVSRERRRDELDRLLDWTIREEGVPADTVLEEVERLVFTNITHTDHPRFFAFVPSPTNFPSVVADFLATGHNVFAGHWLASSAAARIELVVLDWLKAACGLPDSAGGVLVSGGSMANLTAIATAREVCLGGPDETSVVYCSDQTHSSLSKGLRVLGFRPAQRRVIATDAALRLSVPALAAAIAEDRAAGRRPFCVVANAGTTNAGAVDPLDGLADLSAREGLWLHVDGAYGAAAVITERGRAALRGMERADSLTLDPHKWLFQPYEIGCLLVREGRHLRTAFRVKDEDHADYLEEASQEHDGEVNFFENGVQLTRSFRALKLWMSLRIFGLAEFRRAVDVGFDLADEAERLLREDGRWEIVTPSQMAVVNFRWRDDAMGPESIDVVTRRTVERMRRDGYALVFSTAFNDRPVLRLCLIHPGTRPAEIAETIARLGRFATQEAEAERRRISGGG